MKVAIVKVQIKPDKVELYESTFRELAAKVRAHEPRTPFFQLCRDPEVPHGYVVIEVYEDDAAQAMHFDSDYYLASRPIIWSCLEGVDPRAGTSQGEIARPPKGLTANLYETV